ncbi:MAG: hypothetical protein QXV17_07495 [Candidatus Micrarchaeaceae archaeon]
MDKNSIQLNLWTYSYQQQNILRAITNRYFALPKRIEQSWDLTSTITSWINTTSLNINPIILQNLKILYTIPFYMYIESSQDTTPISISTELPIKKFTYNIAYDAWVPTNIEITQIIDLITQINVNFYINKTYDNT